MKGKDVIFLGAAGLAAWAFLARKQSGADSSMTSTPFGGLSSVFNPLAVPQSAAQMISDVVSGQVIKTTQGIANTTAQTISSAAQEASIRVAAAQAVASGATMQVGNTTYKPELFYENVAPRGFSSGGVSWNPQASPTYSSGSTGQGAVQINTSKASVSSGTTAAASISNTAKSTSSNSGTITAAQFWAGACGSSKAPYSCSSK